MLFSTCASHPGKLPDIYYPSGYPLSFGEITPLHTFWGLPITLLVGEVASYNLLILISTVLSGFFTYLWLWTLTGNRAASVLGGLIFAFYPYRMARIAGHLPLVSTQGFPLFFLGAESFVEERKPCGALLTCTPLSAVRSVGIRCSILTTTVNELCLAEV